MDKDFVPYEQALELKQLGFDEPCFGYYEPNGELDYIKNHILKDFPYLAKNSEWQDLVAAPTFSQAFRWFRENHNLHSCVAPTYEDDSSKVILYWFWIQGFDSFEDEDIDYQTREETELICLRKLIQITKENQ
jgi:hypothetical protein